MKKTQLEILLDEHLTSHAELASDARVAPFYKRRSSGESPVKKEASTALADTERAVKSVKRRVTKAAEELTRAGYVASREYGATFSCVPSKQRPLC